MAENGQPKSHALLISALTLDQEQLRASAVNFTIDSTFIWVNLDLAISCFGRRGFIGGYRVLCETRHDGVGTLANKCGDRARATSVQFNRLLNHGYPSKAGARPYLITLLSTTMALYDPDPPPSFPGTPLLESGAFDSFRSLEALPAYGDELETHPLSYSGFYSSPDQSPSEIPSQSAFVLKFTRDDPYHTQITNAARQVLYTTSTRPLGGPKGTRVLSMHITGRRDQVIASYLRSEGRGWRHNDTIAFTSKPPGRRSSWLSTGLTSKTAANFIHDRKSYRWMCKPDGRNVTLELFEGDSKSPIARFLDSRRDWSADPSNLVIRKARMEIQPCALHMLDICVISLLITEILRRAKHVTPTKGMLSDREMNRRVQTALQSIGRSA